MSDVSRNERGFVLITVVTLTWFLFALVGTYFILINVERGSVFRSESSMKAETIAEAGVEDTFWEYNYNNSSFSGWAAAGSTRTKTATYTDAAGNVIGSYTVTVENYASGVAPFPLATSIGTFNSPGGGTVVIVKAGIKPRPRFPNAMLAKDKIRFTGGAFTNSYNSALGPYNADLGGGNFNRFLNGDVATGMQNTANAIDISAMTNPTIGGDALVGVGSTVSNPSKVSGTVGFTAGKVIKDITIPTNMQGLPSLGTLSATSPGPPLAPGDYKFDKIDIGGGNTVEVGLGAGDVIRIWTTGGVKIGGSGQMRVNSGATLVIYTEGDFDAGGNGIANLSGTQVPEALQIYATPTSDEVDVHGGPDLIAVIAAPQAEIKISGSPAFYGAFVGNKITASGGGGVHFDERLLTPTSPLLMDGAELEWLRRV